MMSMYWLRCAWRSFVYLLRMLGGLGGLSDLASLHRRWPTVIPLSNALFLGPNDYLFIHFPISLYIFQPEMLGWHKLIAVANFRSSLWATSVVGMLGIPGIPMWDLDRFCSTMSQTRELSPGGSIEREGASKTDQKKTKSRRPPSRFRNSSVGFEAHLLTGIWYVDTAFRQQRLKAWQ